MVVELVESGWRKLEEGLGELAGLGEDVLHRLHSIAKDVGDIPSEVAEFVDDPRAYVLARLTDLVDKYGDELLDQATFGLGGLATDALASVGLRPLIDGIAEVADEIRAVVERLAEWVECIEPMSQQIFWVLTGAIVGARASGLVESREDLDQVLRSGRLAELTKYSETVAAAGALVECAIKTAFATPLPEVRVTERGPAVPKGTPPMACVMAVLTRSAEDQTNGLAWPEPDLVANIDRLWPEGWRIRHLNPYVVGKEVRYDWTLCRTGTDQIWTRGGWPPELMKSEFERKHPEGYVFVQLGSYVNTLRQPRVVGVLERKHDPRPQEVVFGQQARWWIVGAKAADNPWFSDPLGQHRIDWVKFASPYVLGKDPNTDAYFNVVLEKPDPRVEQKRIGFNLWPDDFANRIDRAWSEGYRLSYISPYTVDGLVYVAAKWELPPTIPGLSHGVPNISVLPSPSPRLTMWGWRSEDFSEQYKQLRQAGYVWELMGSYVA